MRDRSSSVKGLDAAGADDRGGRGASSPPGENVLFDVWLLSRAVHGLLDTALAPAGLTADEFGLYSVLNSAGTLTPSELAQWMSAPPTTVSSYVKRLTARGHLEKQPNPDDGRSSVLRLTPAGRKAHRAGTEAFVPVLFSVLAELGTTAPQIREALGTLQAAVDATTADRVDP